MTLPPFQKEPFLLIPNNVQSQTQGSLCNVSNCQTYVGADGRALPVVLLVTLCSAFSLPDFIFKAQTINCLLTEKENNIST